MPEPFRSGCDVYTDEWDAYRVAIPPEVHFAVKKVRENKSHRRSELYSPAESESPGEKNSGILKAVRQSHGRNTVLCESLQLGI